MIDRILLIDELRKIAVENPELNFGELLYTIQRPKFHKGLQVDLRSVTDKAFATALEKAKKELQKYKDEK
jgi:hypothetical protein